MPVDISLLVQGGSYSAAPLARDVVSGGLLGSVVSVTNRPVSRVPVSGEAGAARPAPSLARELLGSVLAGSGYLYIGNSHWHRIGFDTEAIIHSRPGDRVREKAELKIAMLEDRRNDRQRDLERAVARNDGKCVGEILEVNRRRLSQAQALKARLGDDLSSQIRLDVLIDLYQTFSLGITNKSRPTPGTSTAAVTRG